MYMIRKLMPVLLFGLLLSSCNQKHKGHSANDDTATVKTKAEKAAKPKILFVLTNHDQKGDTGKKTGFFLSEAAHPWDVLKDKYVIDFVSPKGGKAPVDGFDLTDPVNKEFWDNPEIQYKINHTLKPSEINPDDYVAIHFVGGHGAMWDFPESKQLADIAAKIYEHHGVVSAVCHGPAGLVNIKLDDGSYLIAGKKVTGFSNEEEKAVKLTNVVPFLLENKLKERGGIYSCTSKFTVHVVHDGRLITGQNPQSAKKLGKEVLKELQKD
ncbi:dihydroxyacetone kinase [Prolixibacter sp. NT017]|nr:dihydroxyacetone kinase [Prolixibacter sp. NT017]